MILNWKLFLEELVGEIPITDIDDYINCIGLSTQDKLFFLKKVYCDSIVDFGCADGNMLYEISKTKPSIKLAGYDIDDDMISKASSKLIGKSIITSDWSDIKNFTKTSKNPLLNLSSVIHEVYSYSSSMEIKRFWEEKVFSGEFKTITIRDMIPLSNISKNEIENFKHDIDKVKSIVYPKYLKSFENRWGIIDDNYRTLVHFLLKYKYIDNWEREVNENYLPISLETLKKKIPSNYKIVYEDSFILPYLKDEIKKDFDIEITHTTHTKMIIRRND